MSVSTCVICTGRRWHRVTIQEVNPDGTFQAWVHDAQKAWTSVFLENLKRIDKLLPATEEALKKVFARYASDGKIDSGSARGLLSCATNQFMGEDSTCNHINCPLVCESQFYILCLQDSSRVCELIAEPHGILEMMWSVQLVIP